MHIRHLPLLAVLLMLTSCANSVTESSFMMDTVITYNITAENPSTLINECDRITWELENNLSAHISTSEISRFNSGEAVTLSEEVRAITELALDVYDITNGAYDITVAPLVRLWNISHGDESWMPPSHEYITALLSIVGSDKLTLDGDRLTKSLSDTAVDLGGIAKGYALGACAEYLQKNSAAGTVSFGGSIAVVGSKPDGKPWSIGIKNPLAPDELCGLLELESGIVSVSGGYERFRKYDGVIYHHIIDTDTGYPADSDLACATVICESADPMSGALSDALSTALFVMGKEASLALYESGVYDFEAVLVMKDGSITATDGLEGRFTKYGQ